MNSRILPLALALATSPALAEETHGSEAVFQYGGPLDGISEEVMRETVFVLDGQGMCGLAFPHAKELSMENASFIRSTPDGTWCADWPHQFLGKTKDGRSAFAEVVIDGEAQSCYITATYNASYPDALEFDSDGKSRSVETVSLPSVRAQNGALTQMILCKDLKPLLEVENEPIPEEGQVPQKDHTSEVVHESEGLPVFARASYLPTWSGFADGSLQYREGMLEGMPGLPPLRFQVQAGTEPLHFAPCLAAGIEAGGSFAESGSGLTNIGGLVEVKAWKILDIGLSGGAHWEPSEPEAEALQGIPYMALGVRHDFPVVGPLSCGVGVLGEQVFPQGFDFQRGMFALGGEFGCAWEGHVSMPTVGREEDSTQLHFVLMSGPSLELPNDRGPTQVKLGEAQRLREEMGAHAKNQRWSAVEKAFDQIPETERTYNDYYQAAFSARDVGDVALMLSRLQKAQMISNTQEVQDWIRDVELNYAYVRLDETVSGKPEFLFVSSFDPNQRHALDFAKGQYEAEGSFEGFLPIGVQVTLGGVPLPPLKPYGEQKAVQVLTLED